MDDRYCQEEYPGQISLLERQRDAIDACCEKLDAAIVALWEVRGKYRIAIPCLNSYVQTAYSAIATIETELRAYKDRITENSFRDLRREST